MPLCPYLFFDGTCRAAMTAYAEILGGTVEAMETYAKAPPGEPRPEGGDTLIMHASIRLADGSWLMASDDWPGRYTPPASTHVLVTPPDAETARRAFDRLAEGGSVKMALDKTFWTEGFGTLVDRWGTPWMIMVHSDG